MYVFKFADQDSEIEQVHRLNYAAFVEEIPQHAPNPERRLVDQFHDENTYAIVLNESGPNESGLDNSVGNGEVVAMLALRSNRPFSLDRKLNDLDSYLPEHESLCEIRLLYVKPDHRNGKVMKGLMEMIALYATKYGHDMGLISGTTRQQRFYKHLGFVPFGPLVGSGEAKFQPMYLTEFAAKRQSPWVRALQQSNSTDLNIPATTGNGDNAEKHGAHIAHFPTFAPPVNYLPGPVNIPPAVMATMAKPMISHRSEEFLLEVARLQARLCGMVGARCVEFLFGSGTLGNEAVAAQLSLLKAHGLVLVNGEFGQRLESIARRWQLPFETLATNWGETFSLESIEERLNKNSAIEWIWVVHSETSTGVINDLAGISALCHERGVKVCADCTSSLGVVELDLRHIYLATATSGKALGSITGLALVFYNAPFTTPSELLPSYLDLAYYHKARGIPFTANTNLVYALSAALDAFSARTYAMLAHDGAKVREAVRNLGIQVLAPEAVASPAVTTLVLPGEVSSVAIGDTLVGHGIWLSYQSRYLVERNWIQICLMGDYRMDLLPAILQMVAELVASHRRVAA